ncbi:hypothetical protein EV426DRAFT_550749 [Tirmania nivea]|nr:hypothetical protein EV426DRAFT_550749 [Tirmania nivea]
MAPPGVSMPLRFLREALQKGLSQVRAKLEFTLSKSSSGTTASKLQPAPAYAHTHTHSSSLHSRFKVARRWYSTAYRTILHNAAINPCTPTAGPTAGRVVSAMSKMTRTTPFATTLRPRLTGGAFPRTASGYSLGSGGAAGARFFSHGPASPGEVITQVAQAMRAMAMGGKNAAEEYRKHKNGGKVSVRAHLAAMLSQDGTAPGAFVDFHMAPTFTSLSRLSKNSIGNTHFMAALDEDFTEIVNDVATVWSELLKLGRLGDLPISMAKDREDTIRVYFSGCDRETVLRLCDEVGVTRGVVGEDEKFGFELLMPTLEMKPYSEWESRSLHATPPMAVPQQRVKGTRLYWQDMLSEKEGEIEGSCVSDDGDEMMTDQATDEETEYTPPVSVDGYFFEGSSVSGLSPLFSHSEGSTGLMFPPYSGQ